MPKPLFGLKHLFGIGDLSREQITSLVNLGDNFIDINRSEERRVGKECRL